MQSATCHHPETLHSLGIIIFKLAGSNSIYGTCLRQLVYGKEKETVDLL